VKEFAKGKFDVAPERAKIGKEKEKAIPPFSGALAPLILGALAPLHGGQKETSLYSKTSAAVQLPALACGQAKNTAP
jgi:hypothetical protein